MYNVTKGPLETRLNKQTIQLPCNAPYLKLFCPGSTSAQRNSLRQRGWFEGFVKVAILVIQISYVDLDRKKFPQANYF